MGTERYSSPPVQIASGTLTNAEAYGLAAKRVADYLDVRPAEANTVYAQLTGTVGTATLQPQYSLNGTTWVSLGSAISSAGITKLDNVPATAYLRFLVGGTGNMTGTTLTLAT